MSDDQLLDSRSRSAGPADACSSSGAGQQNRIATWLSPIVKKSNEVFVTVTQWCFYELRESAIATTQQFRRIAAFAIAEARIWQLRRQEQEAKTQVGEQLFRHSLGPPSMLEEIKKLSDRIDSEKTTLLDRWRLSRTRDQLYSRLSACSSNEVPPALTEACDVVENARIHAADLRSSLRPQTWTESLRVVSGITAIVLVLLCSIVLFRVIGHPNDTMTTAASHSNTSAADQTQPEPPPERVLVVVVPGTFGNGDFWPTVSEKQSTFGSELARGLGGECKIYPFIWSAPVSHSHRLAAAENLVAVIDSKCASFDRICLVGHSHGGNVALLAAGMCRSSIDTVVCLSTPHIYLKTKHIDGRTPEIPVYCTLKTITRVKHLISISPDTDSVVDGWADLLIGMAENEALELARPWIEITGHPRLGSDSPDFLVFRAEGKNLFASRHLGVKNALNVEYHSQKTNGLAVHHAVHSRRMGFLVGQLLKDGPTAERINYMKTLLQPKFEDKGEPVPVAVASILRSISEKNGDYEHFGWRLNYASIECVGNARQLANDIDNSLPDLFLRGTIGDSTQQTTIVNDTAKAIWNRTGIVVPKNTKLTLTIVDTSVVQPEKVLHSFFITTDHANMPPTRFVADPKRQWYWDAELSWQSLHY